MGPVLLVAPSESLGFYVGKGEVKPRYYNPRDTFAEIHVLEPSDSSALPAEAKVLFGSARVTVHPVGVVDWRSWRQGPLSAMRSQAAIRVASSVRPDAVRGYDPLAAGWIARAAAQAVARPYIVSVHINLDIDVRRSLLRRRRWSGVLLHAFTRLAIERPVLRDADVVVAAYRFVADYVRAMGRPDVRVIYNRADVDRFSPRHPSAVEAGPLRVLTVGSAIPERGLDLAIDALALTDCHLTIVGQGPERPDLERRAVARGIADRVLFIDRVANVDMPDVYRQADIYVSPLGLGGVSIPVLEAAASGLPIVGVRPLPGVEPEIVPEVGIVADRRPEAVAGAVRRLAGDPALRAELGTRARRWSLERGDPEHDEARLYLEVIAGRAGSR